MPIEAYKKSIVELHIFLHLVLDGDERLASCHSWFTPQGKKPPRPLGRRLDGCKTIQMTWRKKNLLTIS
jgi:hypothetical protein